MSNNRQQTFRLFNQIIILRSVSRVIVIQNNDYSIATRHIFTSAYEQKFALATYKQQLVSKHSILGLFAEISVYRYVSMPLVP